MKKPVKRATITKDGANLNPGWVNYIPTFEGVAGMVGANGKQVSEDYPLFYFATRSPDLGPVNVSAIPNDGISRCYFHHEVYKKNYCVSMHGGWLLPGETFDPSPSPDGQVVAMVYRPAVNDWWLKAQGIEYDPAHAQIVIFDIRTGVTKLASRSTITHHAATGNNKLPVMSCNYCFWISSASDLIAVPLRDAVVGVRLDLMIPTLMSPAVSDTASCGVSANDRFLAFDTKAIAPTQQVLLLDIWAGKQTLVTKDPDTGGYLDTFADNGAGGGAHQVHVTSMGDVSFNCYAQKLVSPFKWEHSLGCMFVRRKDGVILPASARWDGAQSNGEDADGEVARMPDGKLVAVWETNATDILQGITTAPSTMHPAARIIDTGETWILSEVATTFSSNYFRGGSLRTNGVWATWQGNWPDGYYNVFYAQL